VNKSTASAARLHRQLVAYIGANPRAADSLGGVMRFWLGLQYADDKLQGEVLRVLTRLVSQGLLSIKTSADGTVLYFASVKRPTGEPKDELAP
jgi:hypothetical protein